MLIHTMSNKVALLLKEYQLVQILDIPKIIFSGVVCSYLLYI